MGFFSSMGSVLGGKASTISNIPQGSVEGQYGDIMSLLFNVPALGQAFQMSSALGKNPWEYLGQFEADKNATGNNIMNLPGIGNKIDIGKLQQANASLTEQYETKQLQFFQDFYDKISEVPAFSDIAQKAKGQNLLTSQMTKAFDDLGAQALGGAAGGGFLADPTKQANVLGPVAFQKAMTEYGIQQEAQNKLLGMAGAGGIGQFSQNMTLGGMGPSPWSQAGAGAAGLFGMQNLQNQMQGAMFNTQAKNTMDMFNMNAINEAGQSILGMFSFGGGKCWVADELYGVGSERAMLARLYANTHDSAFLRVYGRHGKAWAAWLKDNAWAKPLVAPIWDAMVRRGAAMLAGKVA